MRSNKGKEEKHEEKEKKEKGMEKKYKGDGKKREVREVREWEGEGEEEGGREKKWRKRKTISKKRGCLEARWEE